MYHAKLNPKSTRRNVCGMYIPNCAGVMRGPKPQGLSAGLTFRRPPGEPLASGAAPGNLHRRAKLADQTKQHTMTPGRSGHVATADKEERRDHRTLLEITSAPAEPHHDPGAGGRWIQL